MKLSQLIVLIFFTSHILSQSNLEVTPLLGSIINHSPRVMKTPILEPSLGLKVSYSKRSYSGNAIFKKFRYPEIGASINAARYGNNDIFGNSYGAQAFLNFYLKERKNYSIQLTAGAGLGYQTQTYETTNKLNAFIGSHLNATINVESSLEFKFTKSLNLKPSFGILHFSNGRISHPNLGSNYVYLGLGFCYRKGEFDTSKFRLKEKKITKFKNQLSFSPGLSDKGTYDNNNTLPTAMVTYHRNLYTHEFNTFQYGLSAEYKNYDYKENLLKERENIDVAMTFGDEIFFGKTSFQATLGIYLYSISQSKNIVYQRVGINYRLVEFDKIGISIGAQLKAHGGVAELAEGKLSVLF